MSEPQRFTRNYNDQSTDRGFQFEFYCDRCGTGFRTRFRGYAAGTVSEVLNTAGGLFGGILGSAANVGERVKSAAWERAWDKAFEEAMQELTPSFRQCPRCSSWVCRESCWSDDRGLCKNCAPDLGVEMAAAQASHSVQEVWAHARMADEDRKLAAENWKDRIKATCPKCNKPLERNAKFCPNCGEKLQGAGGFCAECGAKLAAGAKFCAECGKPVAPPEE
jgi:membrane protease subunit (stomatin/prohibitin family)